MFQTFIEMREILGINCWKTLFWESGKSIKNYSMKERESFCKELSLFKPLKKFLRDKTSELAEELVVPWNCKETCSRWFECLKNFLKLLRYWLKVLIDSNLDGVRMIEFYCELLCSGAMKNFEWGRLRSEGLVKSD